MNSKNILLGMAAVLMAVSCSTQEAVITGNGTTNNRIPHKETLYDLLEVSPKQLESLRAKDLRIMELLKEVASSPDLDKEKRSQEIAALQQEQKMAYLQILTIEQYDVYSIRKQLQEQKLRARGFFAIN